MKFLTVLIIVFFYRNWVGDNPVRAAVPFERYQSMFLKSSMGRDVRYILCIAVPVLILWLISVEIGDWVAGLLWLIVCVVVLAYGIEVYDAEVPFDDQLRWLRTLGEGDALSEAVQTQADFRARISYEAFLSLHPALFWFLLLGPVGVLIYAMSADYLNGLGEEEESPGLVERVVFWMEWLPARVTGFIYALLGDFTRCFGQLARLFPDTQMPIDATVDRLAGAALGDVDYGEDMASFAEAAEREIPAFQKLLERTVWGWVGIAAIVAVIGW